MRRRAIQRSTRACLRRCEPTTCCSFQRQIEAPGGHSFGLDSSVIGVPKRSEQRHAGFASPDQTVHRMCCGVVILEGTLSEGSKNSDCCFQHWAMLEDDPAVSAPDRCCHDLTANAEGA